MTKGLLGISTSHGYYSKGGVGGSLYGLGVRAFRIGGCDAAYGWYLYSLAKVVCED